MVGRSNMDSSSTSTSAKGGKKTVIVNNEAFELSMSSRGRVICPPLPTWKGYRFVSNAGESAFIEMATKIKKQKAHTKEPKRISKRRFGVDGSSSCEPQVDKSKEQSPMETKPILPVEQPPQIQELEMHTELEPMELLTEFFENDELMFSDEDPIMKDLEQDLCQTNLFEEIS